LTVEEYRRFRRSVDALSEEVGFSDDQIPSLEAKLKKELEIEFEAEFDDDMRPVRRKPFKLDVDA
jgi:hypothetical protein